MRSIGMWRLTTALVAAGLVIPGQTATAQRAVARTLAASDAIAPFTIRVPDAVLADLNERLARVRFPDEIEGAGWEYGTNLAYLKELVAYWRDRFNWRVQEQRLNRFEQFTTNIDGIDIHFIHRRSRQPNALPLILLHGWPGSFVEFVDMIGPLTDPVAHGGRPDDAFDVVIPSLPGYGFSGKPRQPRFNRDRMTDTMIKLMARLGYTRYGVQGGDIGSGVGTGMAIADAAHVAGLHLNLCSAPPPAGAKESTAGVSPDELARMRDREAFWTPEEQAYSQLQGTKPQTLGYSLNDSPVGLAAWIVEKFRTWCDCDGNPETRFTKDELLTNVTLYWVTETPTSAARAYYENRHFPSEIQTRRVEVPTACAQFPKEIRFTPRRWLEARYNLVQNTVMPRGGHFAALEQPELLIEDVRMFFRRVR